MNKKGQLFIIAIIIVVIIILAAVAFFAVASFSTISPAAQRVSGPSDGSYSGPPERPSGIIEIIKDIFYIGK